MEGESEDRHVVNRFGFDEGERDAARNPVEVGLQFLVKFHQALLHILSDLEPNNGEALTGTRGGVNVFDAGDFPQQLLHRPSRALLNLFGAEPRHRDQHIDHGDLDLRLFFPRKHDDRGGAEKNRRNDNQWSQFRIDEGTGNASGEADFPARTVGRCAGHHLASTGCPSVSRAAPPTTTDSPDARPARISTSSPIVLPVFTKWS